MIQHDSILPFLRQSLRLGGFLFCTVVLLQLLAGCAGEDKSAPAEEGTHTQTDYLERFNAIGALPEAGRTLYQQAKYSALQWLAQEPAEVVQWLHDETASTNSPKYRILLHALAESACESAEDASKLYDALPEASRDVFLYWVMLLRAQYAVPENEPRLLKRYLDKVQIARAYLHTSDQIDFPLTARLLDRANLPFVEKQELTELLLRQWLKKDYDAALAYLDGVNPLEVLEYRSFLADWFKRDPEAAVTFAVKANLSEEWNLKSQGFNSLVEMLEHWLRTDKFAVLSWVDAQTDAQVKELLASSLVLSSARTDGLIAARYYKDIENEAARKSMAPEIAKTLADRDPQAGLDWLVEASKKENMHEAFDQFYAHLARYDVGYAVELFPSDQPPMVQKEAADAIMLSAHQVELDQVYDWLESIHPDASKGHSMSWDLKSYAATAPQRVEAFIAKHKEVRRLARPHLNLGYAWSLQDPEAAMSWARSLPEGRGRIGASYGVTEGLLDLNDQMALDWIDSLPPGFNHDWAVDALFESNAQLRPKVVFERALRVEGVNRRRRYMEETIKAMKAQGTLNATEIITRRDISDDDRAWLSDLLQ